MTLFAATPAGADSLLGNGGFESVDAAGWPTGWTVWKPAGDGRIDVISEGAPEGSRAVEIVNDTADDRTALASAATLTAGTSRYAEVSFLERATDVAGGVASVRVQILGSAGTALVPLSHAGKTSGTHDWRRVTSYVALPDAAERLKLEPMMDKATGRLAIDDITVRQIDDVQGVVSTSVEDTGTVELNWSVSATGVDHYTVHRGSDSLLTPSPDNRIATVPDVTTYGDHTAAAGSTYWYVVVARAADDTPLGKTLPSQAIVPASVVDRQETAVLAAFPTGDGVRFLYRLPAAQAAARDVAIYGSNVPFTSPSDPTASLLTTAPVGEGEATWTGTGMTHFLLEKDGVTVTASLAAAQHPRIGVDAERLANLRAAIQEPGHHQASWNAMKRRVDAGVPGIGYGNNPDGHLYRAREAAFIYAVTQDPAYAELAYQSLQLGRSRLFVSGSNWGLDGARVALLYAAAYDWAYAGWGPAQRAAALRDLSILAARYSTFHSANTDLPADKASNWVGITRGMELLVHLVGYGEPAFDNALAAKRIPFLIDELRKHLDQGYGDSGWMQEGANYLQYTMLYVAPAVYAAQDTGIEALDAAFARPDWYNLIFHTASLRQARNMVQYGVGEEIGPVDGLLAVLLPTVPARAEPGYRWLYDRLVGVDAVVPTYDYVQAIWNLLHYPSTAPARSPDDGPDQFSSPVLDDHEGAYHFRNGYSGPNDALLGIQNRNHDHAGWSGSESFALSFMSHDVTWARMPGKAGSNVNLYSVPLVDGQPQTRDAFGSRIGGGETLVSRAFESQPGGYLHLDGHVNFGVDTARREAVVDMPETGTTVVALHDAFVDDTSHTWNWQLRPADGTEITFGEEGGARTFLFRKGDSWLKGWVLDHAGADLVVDNGAFRINRTGVAAEFKVVMTVGRGAVPVGVVTAQSVTLGKRTYDFTDLDGFTGSHGH